MLIVQILGIGIVSPLSQVAIGTIIVARIGIAAEVLHITKAIIAIKTLS